MCGCLRGTKLDQANTGIPENREMREPWDSFLEELDLLTTKLGKIEEQSRKVAAGVAETPSPSTCHGIAFQVDPDDRDRARRLRHSLDCIRTASEDDIALQSNQVVGKFGESVDHRLVVASFNDHAPSVDVPGVAQPLEQRRSVFVLSNPKKADARNLACRLLRARRERPRRHRAAEKRDELAPGAVGTRVTSCPPLRSVHAAFPHTAPTSGVKRRSAYPAKDGGYA